MQLTKKCPKYTYRKDCVYYSSKAVPKDLLDLYCKPRIVKCLGTRSPQSAQFVSKAMLAKLEDYWFSNKCNINSLIKDFSLMIRSSWTAPDDIAERAARERLT